ncbi:MAG: polysaccharide deacetylase family protein [Deltaproteobacteria bacterium]|nr:polysaccharide deacetylase family protein [Deltaproteobacteria bacterium]
MSLRLRSRLVTLLDRSGVIDLAARAQRLAPSPFLRIVGYHRIGDPGVVARETDEGVVDVTVRDFERHVAFVTEHFDVVDIAALRRHFVEHVPLPPHPALITFDDGYRECFDVALPVLERYGATGVFFVSTEHVTKRQTFWWDRIAYLFKHTTKARATVDYPAPLALDLAGDREGALDTALTVVKRTFGLDLERYLEGLASALGVAWTADLERRISDDTLLTWDQLRAMKRAGMDIESHTATHRILQTLSEEELARELTTSKQTLETELDARVSAVAYPSGRAVGQHTPIGRAVRAAGYDLGFSGSGVCRLGEHTDPLDLRRISVDLDVPEAQYRASVVLPPLFF